MTAVYIHDATVRKKRKTAADGQVLDSAPLGHRGIVRAEITPGDGRTLYVKLGAWPLFAWLMLWFPLAVLGPVERRIP